MVLVRVSSVHDRNDKMIDNMTSPNEVGRGLVIMAGLGRRDRFLQLACVTHSVQLRGGGGGGAQHQKSTTPFQPGSKVTPCPPWPGSKVITPSPLARVKGHNTSAQPGSKVTTPPGQGQRSQHLPQPGSKVTTPPGQDQRSQHPQPGSKVTTPSPWPGSKVTTPPPARVKGHNTLSQGQRSQHLPPGLGQRSQHLPTYPGSKVTTSPPARVKGHNTFPPPRVKGHNTSPSKPSPLPPGYYAQAGGMHPTGMHSCFGDNFVIKNLKHQV